MCELNYINFFVTFFGRAFIIDFLILICNRDMANGVSKDLIEQFSPSFSIFESLMWAIRLCTHPRWWCFSDFCVCVIYSNILKHFRFLLQQLYSRLSELLGLHDHLVLLNVIVGKIATNLKCYTQVIFLFTICFLFTIQFVATNVYFICGYSRVRKSLITH